VVVYHESLREGLWWSSSTIASQRVFATIFCGAVEAMSFGCLIVVRHLDMQLFRQRIDLQHV
jgi:hypothetical protein